MTFKYCVTHIFVKDITPAPRSSLWVMVSTFRESLVRHCRLLIPRAIKFCRRLGVLLRKKICNCVFTLSKERHKQTKRCSAVSNLDRQLAEAEGTSSSPRWRCWPHRCTFWIARTPPSTSLGLHSGCGDTPQCGRGRTLCSESLARL